MSASSNKSRVKVVSDIPSIPRLVRYPPGDFSDIVGSTPAASSPIVCGIWTCDDLKEPTEIFEAEYDEVKYILKGTSVWQDIESGETVSASPGSLIWFPKWSKNRCLSSKDLLTFYVEQTYREVPALAEPNSDWLTKLDSGYAVLLEKFISENQKSKQSFDEAVKFLPGGNTRSVLYYDPFPMTLVSGRDCFVTSDDGKEYLDFVSEYSAGMLGHSHPEILKAISDTIGNGINLGGPGKQEVQLAKLLTSRFRSVEKIRFCNSGTEANTMALAVALNFTKRKKVVVFENGYHGGFISFPKGNPMPTNLPHDFVLGRYNDIEFTRTMLTNEVAAILLEPMMGVGGMLPATSEFLTFLRHEATRIGAVLIFDEVITSRLHYNGLQGYWGIYPDMTTLGKYLGGGFSFGAFGGRNDIMDTLNPHTGIAHSGTYNNNVFSMSAGVAACKILTEEKIMATNALGDKLRDGVNRIMKSDRVQLISATGFGSAVGMHIAGPAPDRLRNCFFFYMLSRGMYIGKRGFLSLSIMHQDEHIDRVLACIRDFRTGFLVPSHHV